MIPFCQGKDKGGHLESDKNYTPFYNKIQSGVLHSSKISWLDTSPNSVYLVRAYRHSPKSPAANSDTRKTLAAIGHWEMTTYENKRISRRN